MVERVTEERTKREGREREGRGQSEGEQQRRSEEMGRKNGTDLAHLEEGKRDAAPLEKKRYRVRKRVSVAAGRSCGRLRVGGGPYEISLRVCAPQQGDQGERRRAALWRRVDFDELQSAGSLPPLIFRCRRSL